jgi:phosphate transport system substrate-binding protein
VKITRFGAIGAIALAGAFALSSCAANEGGTGGDEPISDLTGTLVGAGASSQGSAQEAWIAAFQTANPDVDITYDPSGSGAGRETFIAGGSDWAGSDSALNDEELAGTFAACAPDALAYDLPTYISPIAVIFNVDGVDELNLDAETIAHIFKGDITSWDDPAIAALNEGVELPAATITAVHRSDDSGTTKNFSDYLNKLAPEVWDQKPADPFPYQTGEGAPATPTRRRPATWVSPRSRSATSSSVTRLRLPRRSSPSRRWSRAATRTTSRSRWTAPPPTRRTTRWCSSRTASSAASTRTRRRASS